MQTKIHIPLVISMLLIGGLHSNAQGRLLRKIQEKAEDKIVEQIFEDDDEKKDEPASTDNDTGYESSVENNRGGGLSKATPNVMEHIDGAEKAFSGNNFSQTRYEIRQALLGVELEIGQKTLESLPEAVLDLKKVEESDNVTSSGIGFVGLLIERTYQNDDQELSVSIGNDAGLLSATNMYLTSGAYATSTEDEYKRIQFQDNAAIVEYDDYDGYSLSVPFGQSSIFVLNGKNFQTEEAFMKAANAFNMNDIKNQLGEK